MLKGISGRHSLIWLTLSLFFVPGAWAQSQSEPSQSPATPPAQTEPMEIDTKTLDSFVNAYKEVQSIQEKAQLEMQQAVTDNGLSLQDYQQIFNEAWQNPELRNRIEEKLGSEQPS
ncbi:MAG TPA: DUF4168 domain-containing protein [Gammaproteobacteria bacterium]